MKAPVGPLQSGLRALLGFSSPHELRLPEIRSMGDRGAYWDREKAGIVLKR